MSENRFDPKKFADFKFKAADSLKEVLSGEKPGLLKAKQVNPASQAKDRPKSPGKLWLAVDIILTVAIALIIALIIRAFVIQIVYIPTSGMEPNLKAGDRVIVNKLAYSLLNNKKPERGAIVVIDVQNNGNYQVKRIVALPGENVKIKKGQVYINGRPLKETYQLIRGNVSSEQAKVMRGSYYVLGDNREKSLDSRSYGAIPKTRIVGPVFIRIWPLKKVTTYK